MIMGSSNIRGILTSFSPSLDFFAISTGDGRIKKKSKLGSSLLVLGAGCGDVLAVDVYAGQLKWKVSDCHPGGVSAISFPTHGSCIYTAGADGIICYLDSMTGNLLGKFKASTKAISSMSVSLGLYSTLSFFRNKFLFSVTFKLNTKRVLI
ncbi:hypothetical protein F0562_034867 [Nyssa sinensis]|uniref:Uncharacterized protein n=1 Tax=Nyssa sinensis TaxID=561372 RepID=A0A5J5ABH9_9ASTE|nr:hypothetical protein F0562_034867 [Nyssa sinensis]